MTSPFRPGARPWTWLAVAVIAIGGAGVAFVKKQDEDNRFCIACHLHEKLYEVTVTAPPRSLAAGHYRARHAAHPERCFTCHSGEGVTGWTAVTVLSGFDAARWVLGDRHEPTTMRLPIEDRACLKCHAADLKQALASANAPDSGDEGGDEMESASHQSFHHISDHRNVKLACVMCHTVHTPGESQRLFLEPANVQAQCRTCHAHGLGTEM